MDYKELIERIEDCCEFAVAIEEDDLISTLKDTATAIETLSAERDAAVEDLRGNCWCCVHGRKYENGLPWSRARPANICGSLVRWPAAEGNASANIGNGAARRRAVATMIKPGNPYTKYLQNDKNGKKLSVLWSVFGGRLGGSDHPADRGSAGRQTGDHQYVPAKDKKDTGYRVPHVDRRCAEYRDE